MSEVRGRPAIIGIEAGKYRGEGSGMFTVKCLECGEQRRFSWGAVGPLYAPKVLRANGYSMEGRASGARWICPDCPTPKEPHA